MIHKKDRENFITVFLEKNLQLNLSAIRGADGVFVKHVCDAMELQNILDHSQDFSLSAGMEVIDIGTGGGIPLLPLAITHPQVSFTGLDSVRKKTEAVADMAHKMGLKNVAMIWSRAEEYNKKQYDVLTARAVAFSDKLFKRTYNVVKKGGYFVLYKMFSEEEEAWLDSYVAQKKMEFIHMHYYKLYDDDIQRVIYVIKKH